MSKKTNNKFKADALGLAILHEMQSEKVPCISCKTITKTDVHVEYRTGIAVFTKYVCPNCKKEFMEKDLHEPKN